MTTQDLTIDWDDFKAVFKPEPEPDMTFTDDPVAMAVSVHRRWKETPTIGIRWADLEDAQLTDQDRQTSVELRKYYADRIMMTMLGNNKISEFQRKLYGVVTNSLSVNKNEIGLLYRLPYFYEEDLALDRAVVLTQPVQRRDSAERVEGCFTVIESVLRSRRSGDYTYMWMTCKGSSALYLLTIKSDNPYHRLVTKMMEQPRTLSAWAYTKYHKGHHRGHAYYLLGDIEIIE
jgi:hypothetical protein